MASVCPRKSNPNLEDPKGSSTTSMSIPGNYTTSIRNIPKSFNVLSRYWRNTKIKAIAGRCNDDARERDNTLRNKCDGHNYGTCSSRGTRTTEPLRRTNLKLDRHIILRVRYNVDLGSEAFNAFNYANFAAPNATISNSQATRDRLLAGQPMCASGGCKGVFLITLLSGDRWFAAVSPPYEIDVRTARLHTFGIHDESSPTFSGLRCGCGIVPPPPLKSPTWIYRTFGTASTIGPPLPISSCRARHRADAPLGQQLGARAHVRELLPQYARHHRVSG